MTKSHDDRCPDCGANLALVGRAHNCRPRRLLDPDSGTHPTEAAPRNVRGVDMIEAEVNDRLVSLRAENVAQRRRLDEAEATIAELRYRLQASDKGECPVCKARKDADAARAAKYRKRKGGKK